MHLSVVVCELVVILTDENVCVGKTRNRNRNQEEHYVIKILWLETKKEYQNQKLGLLLLYYGILKLKLTNMNLKYVVVDDMTNNSTNMEQNIYNKIGFVSQGQVELTNNNNVKLTGPEKQLTLDDVFINRAKQNIDGITLTGILQYL
jgi:hypothetical protein